jgi:uncharacterized protein DUF1835
MADRKVLHITNGDAAADGLKSAKVAGDVLIWRDVLHDGPVPKELDLHELSKVRATYLAVGLELDPAEVQRSFELRDAHLEGIKEYDDAILWFEHDLYDQLQLVQVLDWLKCNDTGVVKLWLICINEFEGEDPFFGLGQLLPEQLSSLQGTEVPISSAMLDLATSVWSGFRSSDPEDLLRLMDDDLEALPFLGAALVRMLEEYPAPLTGLGRTEKEILSCLDAGVTSPDDLFRNVLAQEESPFMGDWSFWGLVAELAGADRPLISTLSADPFSFPPEIEDIEAFLSQNLILTEDGRSVLKGERDRIALVGYNRWFGGVHMSGDETVWRWDSAEGELVRERAK